MSRRQTGSTLFPYTTLFRSGDRSRSYELVDRERLLLHQRDLLAQLEDAVLPVALGVEPRECRRERGVVPAPRSEEHTSELQSQSNLVCRLLLEKKKKGILLH